MEDQVALLEQFGDALRMMYSMDLNDDLPDDFEALMQALEQQPPPKSGGKPS